MLHERPVIPSTLQHEVLDHLHACHGCANGVFQRATASVFWPGYRQYINNFQSSCKTCSRISPRNPNLPPSTTIDSPEFPFQSICADFFSYAGKNYLIIVDRYSNWLSVQKLKRDTATHLTSALRDYFSHFGVATTLSSDGESIFVSAEMTAFCSRWGVNQRISSAYYPRSNKEQKKV